MPPENLKKTKSARKAQLFLLVFTLLLAVVIWFLWDDESIEQETKTLNIADAELLVEIAETQQARAKGLSGRDDLEDGRGMLFVFDEPDLYSMHMQDMNFSIDIIWLDEDRRVVDIISDVNPDTYPQTFSPRSAANYVLEVPAGFSEEYDLVRGSRASW